METQTIFLELLSTASYIRPSDQPLERADECALGFIYVHFYDYLST